ncbi:MAG: aerotolerance regulator BatA [Ignavibacteriales bacterium CG_4_9_14_3_um_filter_34_10]|nr:MAG: aerotolerance regulator BatA [Ignavibacteriales bacterium CG_4_9_14_3_um_filter_34_10]
MFDGIAFKYSFVLYALILLPFIVWWYIKFHKNKDVEIKYSSFEFFKDFKPTIKERLIHLPFAFRVIALIFLIIALARPQSFLSGENVLTEGIDIVMNLDISSSMLAEDFKPNRLEAAKKVVAEFISNRKYDRIGLVIFAKESFTQCPMTIDYNVIRELLHEIRSGIIEDGTAIGNAIANGVNRLKDSKSKSKVMILVTDGVNNSGEVDPLTAAEIAKTFDVKIYTIGVGSYGQAPYPVQTPFGIRYQMVPVEIDENLLRQISETTGGKYFRAANNGALSEIYKKIDKMEKTKIEITSFSKAEELFQYWAFAGLIILLSEIIISKFYLRKLP